MFYCTDEVNVVEIDDVNLHLQATKIYRDELGDDHPVTVGSLDLFAIIYADVGKKLYEGMMSTRIGV